MEKVKNPVRLLKNADGPITYAHTAGNATIKSAFDMALFDLNAKLAGQPLYKYLGGQPEKDT